MAVTVDTGGRLRAGKPRRVFAGHYSGESQEAEFDVSSDGKGFLMIKSDEASTLRQINVVLSWFEELKTQAEACPRLCAGACL
jgi:hypothetical protein